MKTARLNLNINLLAFLLLMFLLAIAKKGTAQNLEMSTMVQQTVMGIQSGYSVEYRTKSGIGIGSFFQSTNHLSLEKSVDNYPFYGLGISVPIKQCGGLQLLGHLKTGFVNHSYLIATPEIETRIDIFNFLKLGIGAGYRSRQAAISAKLIITTF